VTLLALCGVVFWIVFPVYKRVQRNLEHRSCYSNLKQIALAIKMYEADYNHRLPLIEQNPASSTEANAALYYGWGDAVQIYIKLPKMYQCPDETRQGDGPYQPWESGYTDYFLNSRLSGRDAATPKFPDHIVLLAEGNDGFDIADARYAMPSTPPHWLGNQESPVHRHLDGAYYAFLDGHVKWLSGRTTPATAAPGPAAFTFQP
jgi:prepilin-type processing-associated H-X9-DG protein